MEFSGQDADQENLQSRSETYEPDVQGPLVSQKQSISDLLTEYQNADQAFITKLTALSRDHSTYRQIKRDGKCGWTAAVFGYFESLLSNRAGAAKIQAEIARLQQFNGLIETFVTSLEMVDFAIDATFDFMQNLHDHILHGSANESHLLEEFNSDNQYVPNSIIYHFKLMASVYIQSNPETFANHISEPLDQYCRNSIEPQTQEIDYPGLAALAQGVIGPGGISFDVLYLDRSAGDEVTTHQFSKGNDSCPLVEVLYRPGHYDLIYKDLAPIQVNFQRSMPEYTQFSNPGYFSDLDAASLISPNASLVTGYAAAMAPYPTNSTFSSTWNYVPSLFMSPATPNNNSSSSSTPPTDHLSTVSEEGVIFCPSPHAPQSHNNYSYQPQHHPHPHPHPASATTPHHSLATSPSSSSPSCSRLNNDPIRFNPYTYRAESELPLTTSVFRNSPFNPNHFRNSSFHPQEYQPDEQGSHGGRAKAKRSSSTRSSASGSNGGVGGGSGSGRRDSARKLK